jgi:hypothetical protein
MYKYLVVFKSIIPVSIGDVLRLTSSIIDVNLVLIE